MRYGYFDNANREYVIDRVDIPVSWTNYLGVKDMCMVVNHTAGGGNLSYSTAIGLFNSVVNLVMISLVNFISNKVNGSGLW